MAKLILRAGERIDQLFSTDIRITQNEDVFSYSTDSVSLSRFPKVPSYGLVVDFCSGNGTVGPFASTRTRAPIIEIRSQERLANMAEHSIQLNQLENQVQTINDDLKNLSSHVPHSGVDLILCNPPYFKVSEMSEKNLSEHYLFAKHEVATNLGEIREVTRHALKSNERLAMVHRSDRFLDTIDTMRQYNLAPKHAQSVYLKMDKDANMLLIEAIRDGSTDGLKILPPLLVHRENGDYTNDIFETYYEKNGRKD